MFIGIGNTSSFWTIISIISDYYIFLTGGSKHDTAASAAAGTEAGDGDHHGDQDPFEDQDDEGSHHGGVGAEVELLRVGLVGVEVIGPGGPGPEHHDGAPDEHGEVYDGHDTGGEAIDGHPDLLAAVDLAIPLRALLVHLGPAVDCWRKKR